MKYAATAIVILCLTAHQLPNSHSSPAKKGEQEKQESANPPNQTVAIYNQVSPTQNKGDDKTKENTGEQQLAKFTFYLVLVGLAQCVILFGQGVLFFQQKKIMEQHRGSLEQLAQAAGSNAVAAKENADALINSERAWITVYLKWTEGTRLRNIPDDRVELDIQCIYANRGKSPAWIVEQFLKVEVSNGFYGPDYSGIPDSEIDRKFIPLSPRDTPTSDSTAFRRRLPTKEPAPDNKFILIYGYVKYRDIFTQQGQPRETLFGFFTQIGRAEEPIARIAQPEYNRYT